MYHFFLLANENVQRQRHSSDWEDSFLFKQPAGKLQLQAEILPRRELKSKVQTTFILTFSDIPKLNLSLNCDWLDCRVGSKMINGNRYSSESGKAHIVAHIRQAGEELGTGNRCLTHCAITDHGILLENILVLIQLSWKPKVFLSNSPG